MNQRPIYLLFWAISLLSIYGQAQQDSLQIESKILIEETKDSITLPKNHKPVGNLFVGVDLFTPAISFFTDKQGAQAMVSYRVYKKWIAVAEIGIEKNKYEELDWKVDVDGLYFKLGFNWFVSQDYEDASNGFYTGFRVAYSSFNQHIKQYPIRLPNNQIDELGSLPSANVNAYWVEIVGGARVRILQNFYADLSVRPEIFIGSSKQDGIEPLVIPGFGKDIGPINFSVFWGISYKFF